MQELVTVDQAERALRTLAVVLPVAGLLIGAAIGAVRRRVALGTVLGLAVGLVGPALLGLWGVFNAVVAAYGLDSVRGLLVNLAVFVAIGMVIGLAAGLIRRRLRRGLADSASMRSE